jgi:hypothetical protein
MNERKAAAHHVIGADVEDRRGRDGSLRLCVLKTSSELIGRGNRVTSADHDCAAMFFTGFLSRTIQVEDPA